MPEIEKFYGKHLSGISKKHMINAFILVQGSLYDEFQQYVYTNDVRTVRHQQALFEISNSYQGGGVELASISQCGLSPDRCPSPFECPLIIKATHFDYTSPEISSFPLPTGKGH
jgi:hypothetical protein